MKQLQNVNKEKKDLESLMSSLNAKLNAQNSKRVEIEAKNDTLQNTLKKMNEDIRRLNFQNKQIKEKFQNDLKECDSKIQKMEDQHKKEKAAMRYRINVYLQAQLDSAMKKRNETTSTSKEKDEEVKKVSSTNRFNRTPPSSSPKYRRSRSPELTVGNKYIFPSAVSEGRRRR